MVKTLFGEFSRSTVNKNIDAINAAYESYCRKNCEKMLALRIEIGTHVATMVDKANEINKLTEEAAKASKEHDKLKGLI